MTQREGERERIETTNPSPSPSADPAPPCFDPNAAMPVVSLGEGEGGFRLGWALGNLDLFAYVYQDSGQEVDLQLS